LRRAARQRRRHAGARDPDECVGRRAGQGRGIAGAPNTAPIAVQGERGRDPGADVGLLDHSQPARAHGAREFGRGVGVVEVGIEQMPTRPQHTPHFVEKAVDRGIAMRGLDVDHRVEGAVRNGKGERVTLTKLQSVELVASPAELDRGLGDVDPQHAPRPEGSA